MQVSTHNFHNQSTQATDGEILKNTQFEEITIDIQGTSTDFEVIFEGKVDENSEWTSLMFGNLTDLSLNDRTTKLNTKWNNDISGFNFLRVRIVSISDGYLTVVGRLKY